MIAQAAACFLCEIVGRRPLLIGCVILTRVMLRHANPDQRMCFDVSIQCWTCLNVLLGHRRSWKSRSSMSAHLGHLLWAICRTDWFRCGWRDGNPSSQGSNYLFCPRLLWIRIVSLNYHVTLLYHPDVVKRRLPVVHLIYD